MRARVGVTGRVLVLVLVLAPQESFAQSAPAVVVVEDDRMRPSDTRLFVANGLGLIGNGAVWIDGRRAPSDDADVAFDLRAGAAHEFWDPHLGLVAFGQWGSWFTTWSDKKGEIRTRVDLCVGPEYRVEAIRRHFFYAWRLSAPVGLTLAWADAHSGRLVEERYATGRGFNLGLNFGMDLGGRHHGGYGELSYSAHWTYLDHTETLVSTGESLTEHQIYLDHTLLFVMGYLYRL